MLFELFMQPGGSNMYAYLHPTKKVNGKEKVWKIGPKECDITID